MKNKTKKYIPTFLSQNTRYCEMYIFGIKHQLRTIEENQEDGFYFDECQIMDLEFYPIDVYSFNEWCYVCDGFQWMRFLYSDLIKMSN